MAGRLVHFELPAEDTERAKEFYGSLFGWSYETWEGPVEYHMTKAGGDPGGAIYPSQSGESGPLVYFDVDDIQAAVKQVKKLGGKADDAYPIPTIGWYARCRDTEGNPFSLFQTDESVQPEGHDE
jgi:predicted enzyme related to lactoylglutathione lyase